MKISVVRICNLVLKEVYIKRKNSINIKPDVFRLWFTKEITLQYFNFILKKKHIILFDIIKDCGRCRVTYRLTDHFLNIYIRYLSKRYLAIAYHRIFAHC